MGVFEYCYSPNAKKRDCLFPLAVPNLADSLLLSILELILQLWLAAYVFAEIAVFTWACDYYPKYRCVPNFTWPHFSIYCSVFL